MLKLNETGKLGEKITEWNTSRLHYKCGKQVERPYNNSFQRIRCSTCDDELDAEFNASVNIAVKGISQHSDKSIEPDRFWQNMAGAIDELARTVDDSELEPRISIEAPGFSRE